MNSVCTVMWHDLDHDRFVRAGREDLSIGEMGEAKAETILVKKT